MESISNTSHQLETVLSVARRAKTAGRDAWLAANRTPFFLIEAFVAPDDTGFKTLTAIKSAGTEELVAPIAKRAGANQFGHMITVGRASNNDVCIRYQNISKFHAYLVQVTGKGLGLVDADSTNGTFVRDEQLAARATPALLKSADPVRFSDLSLVFYSPEDLFDLVLSRR